jgi:hypothetical protein
VNGGHVRALRGWVIGAGIFNIAVAFPLANPFTSRYFYSCWNGLNRSLRLGGEQMHIPNGSEALMGNTVGLALTLVGLLLLYAAADLPARIGIPLWNGLIRVAFALEVAYYVAHGNVAHIFIGIAVIDVIIATAFFYLSWRIMQQARCGKSRNCE